MLCRLDKLAVALQALLLCAGVVFIRKAGMDYGGEVPGRWVTQLLWIGIGLVAYLALALADYRELGKFCWLGYTLGVLLLACVLFFGAYVNGSKSVLRIAGGLSLQVSEPMKPLALLFFAWALSHPLLKYTRIPPEAIWAVSTGVPVVLILLQPDMGTALMFVPFSFAVLFLNGLSWRGMLSLLLVALLAIPPVYSFLKPYQKVRLFVFARSPADQVVSIVRRFSPERSEAISRWLDGLLVKLDQEREEALSKAPPGEPQEPPVVVAPVQQNKKPNVAERLQASKELDDWNARQALYSVGSGGIAGRGIGQGIQHTLGFLPRFVAPTDFIFSVIGEEVGFVGSASILLGLLALVLCACWTGYRANDALGASVGVGAAVLYATHVCINVGMCVSWAPIIGIPLPFVSYGGSFMLGMMMLAGLVQSVHIHTEPRTIQEEEEFEQLPDEEPKDGS